MACGLPLLTTRRGGNPEVVDGLGNGIVIDDWASPAAFARAINRVLDDPEGARRMAHRARALAEERFGWDRVARDLLAAFRDAGPASAPAPASAQAPVSGLAPPSAQAAARRTPG